MLRRSWKDWLAATIALALIVWLVGTSEAFKSCIHERKNQQPYRALHERSAIIGITIVGLRTRIGLNVACAGNFADSNQGAITALATALLAIFTFTLWRSTSRLWKVSIEHADIAKRALLDVERPHVLIEDIQMHGFQITAARREEYRVAGLLSPSIFPRVTFSIRNHGKSPAWVISEVTRFIMIKQLPVLPQYYRPIGLGRRYVIPPGGKLYGECRFETNEISDVDRLRIVKDETRLFVYGYVDYEDVFSDISSNAHRSAYCWRYIVGGGADPGDRFEPSGPNAYWSYT